MPIPGIEYRIVRSFDGTKIAYQVRGEGPAVVLSNGLGGSYAAWRHQYAALGDRHRVICWDYRGLYRSERPAQMQTLAIEQQVRDLEAILAAEHIDRALFIGWSMGVQFNFEYYRRHADQFVGLVVLNGAAGRPFRTAALGVPLFDQVAPGLLSLMRHGGPLIRHGTRLASGWNGLIPLLKRLGMVGETLDEKVFNDLAGEFASLDFEAYAETFRHLGDHDASDVLPHVHTPTLILTGSRDAMTPLKTARRMAQLIPDARLVVIEGGTHYTAVEYPAEVNHYLLDFVAEIGHAPPRAATVVTANEGR